MARFIIKGALNVTHATVWATTFNVFNAIDGAHVDCGLLCRVKPPRAEAGELFAFVVLAGLTLLFFTLGAFVFQRGKEGVQRCFGPLAHFGSSIPKMLKKTNASKPREIAMTISLAAANAVDLMTER